MTETFGKKLKRWREAVHVSQAELARRMDVSPTWVSNLERDFSPTAKGGRPQPSMRTCDKIARALGMKTAEVRLAAGYAPSDSASEDMSNARASEATRAARLIRGFLILSPEQQDQALQIIEVLRSKHPEILNTLQPPITIVDADDLTESDVEITGNTPP